MLLSTCGRGAEVDGPQANDITSAVDNQLRQTLSVFEVARYNETEHLPPLCKFYFSIEK